MFTQIAAEQPDLQVPTEEQIGSAYSRWRRKARSLSMATDVGFRMPSVWLAEGHSGVAPVYLYRFDYSTPLLKLLLVRPPMPPNCLTSGAISEDPRTLH